MKWFDRERNDWAIVLTILLFGFLCVIGAAQWALRFSPGWTMDADMASNVDLNGDFLTSKPVGFFEPVDPAILTLPPWSNFLTPGARIVTRTPLPPAPAAAPTEPETIPVAANTIAVPNTAVPTNTSIWLPQPPAPPTQKPKDKKPPPDTPVDTPMPTANLTLTNADDADFYDAGSTRSYTITVSNPPGSDDVSGATVSSAFAGGPVASTSWSCIVAVGTTCGLGGPGNLNDVVDLPAGASITYRVDATADGAPTSNLEHTALVDLPAGYASPTSFSAIDIDTLLAEDPILPPGINTLGLPHTTLPADGSTTIIRINGDIDDDAAPDLVYYEELVAGGGILMDKVIIEISDGKIWYPLFNWGDDQDNNGTNLVSSPCGVESDNCPIPAGSGLDGDSGVLIDIPASIPDVTGHFYIAITVPAQGPGDDADVKIDAILPW